MQLSRFSQGVPLSFYNWTKGKGDNEELNIGQCATADDVEGAPLYFLLPPLRIKDIYAHYLNSDFVVTNSQGAIMTSCLNNI